jgi:hypothetical protein
MGSSRLVKPFDVIFGTSVHSYRALLIVIRNSVTHNVISFPDEEGIVFASIEFLLAVKVNDSEGLVHSSFLPFIIITEFHCILRRLEAC